MTFRRAVQQTPSVANHYRDGLQALHADDRARVRTAKPRHLRGSVNLETALRARRPGQPIWDYVIGFGSGPDSPEAIWLEPHPASSDHIAPVIAKFEWLVQWMRAEAPELHRLPPRFIWLATGSVALAPNDPKRKLLAAKGIEFAAGRLNL